MSTYSTWNGMRSRCNNPNHIHYGKYGGRGIKCCDRWSRYDLFLEDMGEKPMGTELDRIDNDGNYHKENCRWTTASVNLFNSRHPRKNNIPRGVHPHGKGFLAQISIEGKKYHLGKFETIAEAKIAYDLMCLEWYGKLPPCNLRNSDEL